MKKFWISLFLLTSLAGGWALWSLTGAQASSGTTSGNLSIVKIGSIQSLVTAQGTLEPKDYVDVGAQVSGEVIKLHVEIGDRVKAGDLIAEIDSDVYEAQVKYTKAQLKMLAAQKAQQEALIKQAQRKYERNERLYNERAVSKETFEDSEIDLDVAKASLMSLEAQIEQAQSSLEEDETNLNYTKIYTPMDGTVVDQSVEEGETINANQTTPTIVQIANMDIMTAKAEVAEADVMKLKEGMKMYFTTLGSGDRRWEGETRQILPTPEEINDVVLYNVLVDVANDDHTLLPGMTTQMFFVLESAVDVPLIPIAALGKRVNSENLDAGQAYTVNIEGKSGIEERTVIVGLTDRTQAAVISGVEVGEKIITVSKSSSSEKKRNGPPMRL
ncbi:MAG: efflux RND transporter periplasmic adaptor subunit [Alcanivorax sp.]